MVRIVRAPEGGVYIDETGKKPGRGAYICRSRTCWEEALKGKQLEHALKTTLSEKEKATLAEFVATLPGDGEAGQQ